ncbi:hypothetical protein GJR96_13155 [Haloferax sp. MBLA0076]|uniref:Transporter n=1 Tax=Haloferax litoreum TaxID=2666140 RepID=A0A6A8GIW0_9EURY|nr:MULTISPECIES: hypothetical protein [Haloferax]KAB1194335.1 hypothetical protein Hfx1148_13095 [Haloferax sp. CBA1148]MRX22896.1 hypothetical protein [Haloferax litoreum]
MPADDYLTPTFVLFVGGFVAAIFFAGAILAYVVSGGVEIVTGLALALAGIGGVFLVVGVVGAGVMRYLKKA